MSSNKDFFPHSDRVVYANNPLAEVICQLRFPTVLKIESDLPAEFQERIRHRFPDFETDENELVPGLPEELRKLAASTLVKKSYRFRTEDEISTVSLSREAIALSATKYVEWEDFKNDLSLILTAAVEIYKPSSFSRIGLRYKNLIDRDAIGLGDEEWCSLLIPQIAAELCLPQWRKGALEVIRRVRAEMNEEGDHVLMQHGLVIEDERTRYLLDFDYYYTGRVETSDADPIIQRLHGHSGNAFRWAITPRLHDALGPSV